MATMPPALAQAAQIHHTNSAKTGRETANAVQAVWREMQGSNFTEKSEWYRTVAVPMLVRAIRNGQAKALVQTMNYLKVTAAIQGIDDAPLLNLAAFIVPEESAAAVLNTQIDTYVAEVIAGKPENLAKLGVGMKLMTITQTAVADAGRDASSASILGTEGIGGYYRVLDLPACPRCAVMAGRWYAHNEGFERHPRCQCTHLPAGEAYDDATTDPREAIAKGQVTGLSKKDTEAILDHGADVSQVINAKSGMYKTSVLGEPVEATYSGTTVRALAGRRLGNQSKQAGSRYRRTQNTRLTVGQIMKLAEDNPDRAKEMLWNHGYLT